MKKLLAIFILAGALMLPAIPAAAVGDLSWSDPVELWPANSSRGGIYKDQQIAVSADGRVQAVVVGTAVDGVDTVTVIRSINGGVSWEEPVHIPQGQNAVTFPEVSVSGDGSTIAVVWRSDLGGGDYQVLASVSDDSGVSWSTPAALSPVVRLLSDMKVSVTHSGDVVSAMWVHNTGQFRAKSRTYVSATTNNGGLWSTAVELTPTVSNSSSVSLFAMDASASGTEIGLAWFSSGIDGISLLYSGSADGGLSWSDPIDIIDAVDFSTTELYAIDIDVSSDGQSQSIVWAERDLATNNRPAKIVNSRDAGNTWSDKVSATPEEILVVDVSVAISNGGDLLDIAWIQQDEFPDSNIYSAVSSDGGVAYSDPRFVVTSGANNTSDIDLHSSEDSQRKVITWGGPVRYTATNDGGLNWTEADYVTNQYNGVSNWPRLAATENGSLVSLVWRQYDANTQSFKYVTSVLDFGDLVAPTVAGQVTTEPNENGWHQEPVTIQWSVEDEDPEVTIPEDTVANIEGTNTYISGEACDTAGNCATGEIELSIDLSAPEVLFTGQQETYEATDTITITCDASDAVSPVVTTDCPDINDQPAIDYVGENTLTATATDAAGNTTSTTIMFTVLEPDTTPPTVTGEADRAANENGWYNASVVIDWTAVDPEPSSGAASDPADTLAELEGTNTYTSEESCDAVNNCAAGELELSIDTVAPTVSFTGQQATYNEDATIVITCEATDATSGVDTTTLDCPEISGPASDYIGTNTLTATAIDLAGNTTTVEITFEVTENPDDIQSLIDEYVEDRRANRFLSRAARRVENANGVFQCYWRAYVFNYYVEVLSPRYLTEDEADTLAGLAYDLCG